MLSDSAAVDAFLTLVFLKRYDFKKVYYITIYLSTFSHPFSDEKNPIDYFKLIYVCLE